MSDRTIRWLPVIISVLVVIVTVAVAWGSLGARVSDNADDIDNNQREIDSCEDMVIEVREIIPQIQSDLEWIKGTLRRMENDNE